MYLLTSYYKTPYQFMFFIGYLFKSMTILKKTLRLCVLCVRFDTQNSSRSKKKLASLGIARAAPSDSYWQQKAKWTSL